MLNLPWDKGLFLDASFPKITINTGYVCLRNARGRICQVLVQPVMESLNYEWIDCTQSSGVTHNSAPSIVRTQAMKFAGAARKRTGTWGKRNLGQSLILEPDNVANDKPHRAPQSHVGGQAPILRPIRAKQTGDNSATSWSGAASINSSRSSLCIIAPSKPHRSFEWFLIDVGFDVLQLDELTAIATGQVAGPILSRNSGIFKSLISRRRQSYLWHVPSRYGNTTCLEDALRCIATRANRRLSSSCIISDADELKLYGKALHSIQAAVNDRKVWEDPDVLCSIVLLSTYEVGQSAHRMLCRYAYSGRLYSL